MAEPTSTAAVGAAGGAGIMAVGALLLRWLAGREINRLDSTLAKHAKAIETLQGDSITKADLTAFENRLRETITGAVGHLSERIGDVKETAKAAHTRIDGMRDQER